MSAMSPRRNGFTPLTAESPGAAAARPKWMVIAGVAAATVVTLGGIVALNSGGSAKAAHNTHERLADVPDERQALRVPASASLTGGGGPSAAHSPKEAPLDGRARQESAPAPKAAAPAAEAAPPAAKAAPPAAKERLAAAPPAAKAASPVRLWREGFDPVNGGDDQSCHGPHGEWETPYRIHHLVPSLENCQDLCKNSFRCTGLGYTAKTHLCEVWTKPISGSDAEEGKQCFRYQPRGFKPMSGGADRACAAAKDVEAESGTHYVEHRVHSLYECKIRCHVDSECLGVDYDKSSHTCQIWIRPVAGSKKGTGHLCLRREPPGFMPQEKGLYHECTLDKDDDDTMHHSKVHSGDRSLYECQARCAHHGVKCKGINYDGEAGTCEMWTLPINASRKVGKKNACLRFEAPPPDSLYCVGLVLPWTDEPAMMEAQLKHRLGIFACDGFAVFSNPVTKLGHLETKLIDMDLHAEIGGEYNTSLNTPMFVKLWELVGSEGTYKDYGWMVKADPDTVFFPERLRWIVSVLNPLASVSENGAFLNNCQLGLHGPLEVINVRALDTYLEGASDCWQADQEDVYMENCFHQLEVDMINNFDTIAEKDCWRDDWHQYPDWKKCETPHAAFHPFKSVKDYHGCWGRAMRAGNWPPAVLHDELHD